MTGRTGRLAATEASAPAPRPRADRGLRTGARVHDRAGSRVQPSHERGDGRTCLARGLARRHAPRRRDQRAQPIPRPGGPARAGSAVGVRRAGLRALPVLPAPDAALVQRPPGGGGGHAPQPGSRRRDAGDLGRWADLDVPAQARAAVRTAPRRTWRSSRPTSSVRSSARLTPLDPQAGTFIGGYSSYYDPVIAGASEFASGQATHVAGLEAPDARTLIVRLNEPNGELGHLFALPATAPIPALPGDPAARFGIATGLEEGFGRRIVASGPYMYEGSERLDFRRPRRRPATGPGLRAERVPDARPQPVVGPCHRRAAHRLRRPHRGHVRHADGLAARSGRGRLDPADARTARRAASSTCWSTSTPRPTRWRAISRIPPGPTRSTWSTPTTSR